MSTQMAFKFNATSQEVRSLIIDSEPFFVAKDICDILGLSNSRIATANLDSDEKADVSLTYSSSNGTTQNRKTKVVSESGLYALILKSRKPQARAFRKWVTSEVLPTIRKKGYYGIINKPSNFIDIRDVPFTKQQFNGFNIRVIEYKNQNWYSLVDIHRCIGSQTCITQAAKKLNTKKPLAKKIWLFGATQPAWYTTKLGFKLIISGSRVFAISNQLKLN